VESDRDCSRMTGKQEVVGQADVPRNWKTGHLLRRQQPTVIFPNCHIRVVHRIAASTNLGLS
jgi:hypothetical protein